MKTTRDRAVRILIVEDNLNDEILLRETLAASGLQFEAIRVETEPAFRRAMEENFDVILSDYSLPAFNGRAALAIARELRPDIPFMFLSGTIGEEAAIESLLSGAADYVLKHRYGRLVPAVRRVLAEAEERQTRVRAEQQLQVTLAQLRSLFENLDDVFFSLDIRSNTLLQISPACEPVYGLSACTCYKNPEFWKYAVHRDDFHIVEAAATALQHGQPSSSEYRIRRPDDSVRWVHAKMKPFCDANGTVIRVDAIVSDVTERKDLEAKFLRTQRLENLGSLAGGIVHDLNNVLSPIVMGIELLKARHEDSKTQDTLTTLRQCALRGANLVKQILMFARGVDGRRVKMNPDARIVEVERMLRHAFPKSIRIAVNRVDELWEISADPTQFEQVLMNLCVNARDAMPDGGELRIRVRNEPATDGAGTDPLSVPQVTIEVIDTGQGIPAGNLERVFDPFFSTKEVGHGTGLGLSTVQAIVRSHGGTISVQSVVGQGTTFRVSLPALTMQAHRTEDLGSSEFPFGNGECILVVEDEAAIRNMTRTMLEHYGYQVLVAADGREGINIYNAKGAVIGLVLTDQDMPIMEGLEMSRELRQRNPHVRIISTSGLGRTNELADAVLQKPFATQHLLQCVQKVLRAPKAPLL